MSLVAKDEGELYTNVDKGLLKLSLKCDDILLYNNLLPFVKDCEGDCEGDCEEDCEGNCEGDCEGDSEGDCEVDSKTDCEGDSEDDFEVDSEGDCEEVGEGYGEKIVGSSVDEKRD